jgi:hypothetical protein
MGQRKIILGKSEFVIQEMAGSGEDFIMVKHRTTKTQASNVDFNKAMSEVLEKLSDHYGCRVIYREYLGNA